MRALRELLGIPERPDAHEPQALRRIAAQLDGLEAQQARYLAAFAYVLARVARADLEVSGAERERIAELLSLHSGFDASRAALVAELAGALQAERGGTDNYVVTRRFRELSTREQRIELLDALFAVAAADQSISETESTEIVKIGAELGFAREEIAALRSRFRAQLAVLRPA